MNEVDEFHDVMLTVGLAMAMAKKYGESMDDAVRGSALAVSRRIQYNRTREVFTKLSKDSIAAAVFYMMVLESKN